MSPLTALAAFLVLAYASVSAVPAGGNLIRVDDPFKPRPCQKNAHFVTCGTACPDTCENKDNPPMICTMQCVIGCACDKGFYKTKDHACVRAEECA